MHYDSQCTSRVQERVTKLINQLEMALLHYQQVIRRAQARDAMIKAVFGQGERFCPEWE
ncbi:MAG TPA: hypothetical protein VJ728_08270 [Candidatus Binataceae bacterium]|nr:hypothetical protein [Candidatus Binataceae bacterium]